MNNPNYNSISRPEASAATTVVSSSPYMGRRLNNNNNNTATTTTATATSWLLSTTRRGESSLSSVLPDNDSSSTRSNISDQHQGDHLTTTSETVVHLLKGYIGTGCLSLPWAVSQLGSIVTGVLAIAAISAWTSYNCWTVVKLKRVVQQQQGDDDDNDEYTNNNELQPAQDDNNNDEQPPPNERDNNNNTNVDTISENRSVATSHNTSITFPAVGHWAYGHAFEQYVTYAVCIQQLAICTVYFSFVGENVLALLEYMQWRTVLTTLHHVGVVSLSLPVILVLSWIPTLRQMSPVLVAGTITLFSGFAVILYLVVLEWNNDDNDHDATATTTATATFRFRQAPLALCGILYSFEGICLILPVESAMKEPQHFQRIFTGSMILVALIFATFASLCVAAFGVVTNGSITAFLLQDFSSDSSVLFWIMVANALVSASVVLSYPLMLLPALELIASQISHAGREWDIMVRGGAIGRRTNNDDDDKDLSPFEPLPSLPEHDVASLGDDFPQEHAYEILSSNFAETDNSNTNDDNVSEDGTTTMSVLTAMILPEMHMPGDSPQLRAGLVLMTFVIAVLIPNVQSLISLAGALAGTSTALLIPPLMELAWIRQLESGSMIRGADLAVVDGTIGAPRRRGFLLDKIKCYVLFTMGLILGLIGSYASIQDIIRSYSK